MKCSRLIEKGFASIFFNINITVRVNIQVDLDSVR